MCSATQSYSTLNEVYLHRILCLQFLPLRINMSLLPAEGGDLHGGRGWGNGYAIISGPAVLGVVVFCFCFCYCFLSVHSSK